MPLVLSVATVQGLQLYFVAPVEILSCVPTDSFAKSLADTLAVTVFPVLLNALITAVAAAPLAPGIVLAACIVAALVMELMATGPVPSIASVIAVFDVSKTLALFDKAAAHPDPDGQ